MFFSSRSKYALQAMIDLALYGEQGPIAVKDIAKRQEISEYYLEQLISSLRKAGLVQSIRGSQGGYVLAKKSKNITVGDIIRVLEGPIHAAEQNSQKAIDIGRSSYIVYQIQQKITSSIVNVIDSITLEDLSKEIPDKAEKTISYLESL